MTVVMNKNKTKRLRYKGETEINSVYPDVLEKRNPQKTKDEFMRSTQRQMSQQ